MLTKGSLVRATYKLGVAVGVTEEYAPYMGAVGETQV